MKNESDPHMIEYDFLTRIEKEYYKGEENVARLQAAQEKVSFHENNNSDKKARSCFRFDNTNSLTTKVFDFLHGVNLLYIMICIPIQIGFTIKFAKFCITTEIVSLTVSILYIMIKLRTPIEIQRKQTLELRILLKHYYLNQGLVWDLFSILPVNLLCGIF